MMGRRRLTAGILAVLVLFVTVVSGFEIACEAHHICIGENCRICAHITVIRGMLRVLSLAVASAAVSAIGMLLRRRGVPFVTRAFCARSPVLLKDRLLN